MIGAGQGYIMTPLLNLVLGFVDEAESGMASGVISTVKQVGAFVAGMGYNLGAAVLICLLLMKLVKRSEPVPR